MPLIEQKLDTGFTAYKPKPVEKPPEPDLSSRAGLGALFTGDFDTFHKVTANAVETIAASFRMENDVVNTIDLLTQPIYKADPNFNLTARLKADNLWNDYSENFVGVASEAEYLAKSGRIAQELKDRTTLEAAGLGGFVAMMGAGLLSPTSLLPFVGGLKGGRAIAMGAGMGFAGGALQEIPLQLAQETRSAEETIAGVAMATVLGGVLGGAVAFARRDMNLVGDDLVRMANADMDVTRGGTAISKTSGDATSAGAASAAGPVPEMLRMSPLPKAIDPLWDAYILPITSAVGNLTIPNALQGVPLLGRMAGKSLGELTPDNLTRIFPVIYNLTAQADQAKRLAVKLSDSGMVIKGAPVGGTVESRIRTYDAPLAAARDTLRQGFAKYMLGEEAGSKFGRAQAAPFMSREGKLKFNEFRNEIGRAMRQGDQHEIPEVAELATYLRKEVYDPLFKAAKEQGMFKGVDEELLGDSSYLNRVYDLDLVAARKPEFIKKLEDHFNEKLTREFREAAAKLTERSARDAERAEDFARPYDEVVELRKQFLDDLKALEEGRDEDLVALEDAVADKRSAARDFERGSPERKAANDEARALEQEGGAPLAETKQARATIRRRLKNLNQAYSALTERQQGKLDKIARAEDLSFSTLQRFAKSAAKILAEFDKVTDEQLDAALVKLRGQFAETAARYDQNESRIAAVFDDEFVDDVPTSPFAQLAKVETETFDKMTVLANRIEDAEGLDREALRDLVQQAFDDATVRAQGIVERRAVRSARLADQAADLDPDKALARSADLKAATRQREADFAENWRERGADSLDPITGVADFRQYAREIAESVTDKILGTNMRLPGMDIIMNERGAELARVLDIDSNSLISAVDNLSFLVDDADELVGRYVRTLAPDIELHRAFGDFAPDMEKNLEFKKLNEEYLAIIERTQSDMRAGVNPKTRRQVDRPYTQEQIDKATQKINAEHKQVKTNLEAMIARARYQFGLPKDPSALGARAGRIARNLNVSRFMGGVTISSLPDVGRPIMKYGLIRTAKQGYIPFIKRLSTGTMLREGMTSRHLRASGSGLDTALQGRMQAIFGTEDYLVPGTKIEKALEWTSSRMGILAGFAPWTDAGKQIAGSIANARVMDSIAVVAGGEKASAKELAEAVNYLAAGGIDDSLALQIWRNAQKEGGSDFVDGQWWSNTEVWDRETARAYNAFLYRETANTIITPGIDMPLFVDSNPMLRLLFQFKSFGMTSTTRALMAGLQQRDMAFYTGSMISLAMGGLSYYIYANIVGGRILTEMQNALAEGDWGHFADEAINRSGLLGIGADLQSISSAVPGLSDKVSFGGARTTRQGGANLLETVGGPTFGDLANTMANIATGAYSPTQGTLHQLRSLTPLQNHTVLRRIFDQVEGGVAANLPESR